MNNQEREAFEAGINPHCRKRNEHGDYVVPEIQDRWDGFQAGAAYQREQVKGLVEALLDVYRNGFSPTRSERVNEALATYHAAQERK